MAEPLLFEPPIPNSLPDDFFDQLDFNLDNLDFSFDEIFQSPLVDESLEPERSTDGCGRSLSSQISGNSGEFSGSGITADDNLSHDWTRKRKLIDDPIPNFNEKHHRLSISSDCNANMSEEVEKRKARLVRNRESAQLSRQRKKQYVEELENKVKSMQSTIAELNRKVSFIIAENVSLRQQLGGSMPMMPVYQAWPPHGSLVPPVPIPRLKSQQATPLLKAKAKGRTKKLTSISLLGILFVMLLYGGLSPDLKDRSTYSSALSQGKVWSISGHGSPSSRNDGIQLLDAAVQQPKDNEKLPVLLYIPRNGKHVKINGNLLVHSVLASERAVKNGENMTALAIPGNGELVFGASSNPSDVHEQTFKSNTVDGSLQEWLNQGLGGPLLSSSICTEVFSFDVSPSSANSSGIVKSTSAAGVADKLHASSDQSREMRYRRILHSPTIPLTQSTLSNHTEENHLRKPVNESKAEGISAPSMVVSVLFDPRDFGTGDSDGMISSKSLSRIFVVVLLDSVKYITYSCVLPMRSAAQPVVAK